MNYSIKLDMQTYVRYGTSTLQMYFRTSHRAEMIDDNLDNHKNRSQSPSLTLAHRPHTGWRQLTCAILPIPNVITRSFHIHFRKYASGCKGNRCDAFPIRVEEIPFLWLTQQQQLAEAIVCEV